jgi:hypothetical protein
MNWFILTEPPVEDEDENDEEEGVREWPGDPA